MKVVVGGTYRDYKEWLRDNKVSERDAIYVNHPDKLMGLELKPEDVVRLGYMSPAMEALLKTRIR